MRYNSFRKHFTKEFPDMKRLFVAVPVQLSVSFTDIISKLQKEFARDQIVWVKPELQHLTLRFLGQTPDSRLDALKVTLRELSANSVPFELILDKIGVFGSRYAPTTLWFGFSHFEPFRTLFDHLEPKLKSIGFEPNYGNFVPHLTVGRIKRIDQKKKFTEQISTLQDAIIPQTIKIDHIDLIRSKLLPSGPQYTTLETFQFL